MPKVCLQAGHGGVTSGATGASGERDWTTSVVPKISELLKAKGVETYTCGGKGYEDNKVTDTDWDLFLAVHYDADIYNDRGGFVDYPDPSADAVWETSKQLAYKIGEKYFKTTGIPERPSRSNANTKFYYMWSYLTANTPCVIIECGVGWRKPDDYEILRRDNNEYIAQVLADSILYALGMSEPCEEYIKKIEELDKELDDMRASRDKWKRMFNELEKKYETEVKSYKEQIENLQKSNAELTAQLSLMSQQYKVLLDEKNALQSIVGAQKVQITELTEQVDKLSENVARLAQENGQLKLDLSECKKKLKQKLCEFPYRDRVLSLIRCRK